jgi:hypothetical protein
MCKNGSFSRVGNYKQEKEKTYIVDKVNVAKNTGRYIEVCAIGTLYVCSVFLTEFRCFRNKIR